MKFVEKICWVLALAMLTTMLASCSSSRELTKEEELKIKSEFFQKAHNLIHEKCVLLGIENDVIFELDSTTFHSSSSKTYDNSWLRRLLDIPRQFTSFGADGKITVRSKPYLWAPLSINLNDSLEIFDYGRIPERLIGAGRVVGRVVGHREANVKSTSVLEFIHLGNDIENCNRPYRQMPVETAIERARTILSISDTIPCVEAHSKSRDEGKDTYCHICDKEAKEMWVLGFLLEPHDTTYYYARLAEGMKPSDIIAEIPSRDRHWTMMKNCYRSILWCEIEAESGEICDVYLHINNCEGYMAFGFRQDQLRNPKHDAFLDRIDSICKSKYRYYLRRGWSK